MSLSWGVIMILNLSAESNEYMSVSTTMTKSECVS